MEERKPHFEANSVLPDFVIGLGIDHAKQGYGPSTNALYAFWKGDELFKMLPPQYAIDVRDTALLHMGGLLHPEYKGERIFGYAHRKNWPDYKRRLQKLYPEHEFPGTFSQE
jgi:hypothetical protein